MLEVKLKTVFIIFGIGMFSSQMYKAMEKLMYPSTAYVQENVNLDDIDLPSIYICANNQFNYTVSVKNGYKYNTDYVLGKVAGSEFISWRGNDSLTAADLNEQIYNPKGQQIDVVNGAATVQFIQPFGFCYKVTNMREGVKVRSFNDIKVYVVDPQTTNDIRIETIDQNVDMIEIAPVNHETYEGKIFTVNLELIDESIHDGLTCTDYKIHNSTYGNCEFVKTRDILQNSLGCLPFWFPAEESKKCQQPLRIPDQDKKDEFEKLGQAIYNRQPLHYLGCKPSCLKTKASAQKLYYRKNYIDFGQITLKFDNQVKVNKLVYTYGLFELMTELGSSLGLWLGLSIINLLDAFTYTVNIMMKKLF